MSDPKLQKFEIRCRACGGKDVYLEPAIVKFPERSLVLLFHCRQCAEYESIAAKSKRPPA